MQSDFEAIIRKYTPMLFSFSKRFVLNINDIEDIIQTTFLNAYKRFYSSFFETEGKLKSWLIKICHNEIKKGEKDIFAELNEEIIGINQDLSEISDSLDAEIDNSAKLDAALLKLRSLKPIDQEIIRLRIFEEMKFAEIGYAIGQKEENVKMRFFRAIKKLKEELDEVK